MDATSVSTAAIRMNALHTGQELSAVLIKQAAQQQQQLADIIVRNSTAVSTADRSAAGYAVSIYA